MPSVAAPYGLLTLLALAVLVYGPMPVYTWNWVPTQVLLIASALALKLPPDSRTASSMSSRPWGS